MDNFQFITDDFANAGGKEARKKKKEERKEHRVEKKEQRQEHRAEKKEHRQEHRAEKKEHRIEKRHDRKEHRQEKRQERRDRRHPHAVIPVVPIGGGGAVIPVDNGGGYVPVQPLQPPVLPDTPTGGGGAPSGGGGGGGDSSGGGDSKSGASDSSSGSSSGGFMDDLKSHALGYTVATLGVAGLGYFIGVKKKPEHKWLIAGAGALAGFGLAWLYFNKLSGASADKTAASDTKPAEDHAAPTGGDSAGA